jgi:hypothetical protein
VEITLCGGHEPPIYRRNSQPYTTFNGVFIHYLNHRKQQKITAFCSRIKGAFSHPSSPKMAKNHSFFWLN